MRPLAFLALIGLLAACDTTGVDDGSSSRYVELGTFDIDPKGTYLRTNEDNANSPLTIDLAGLGLQPGDSLIVRVLGNALLDPASPNGGESIHALGVFSSSATLLDASELNRIPGAIDTPGDFETGRTLIGDLPTDIPEDFLINRGRLVVPAGATTLFVAPEDRFYEDNEDDDHRVTLSTVAR